LPAKVITCLSLLNIVLMQPLCGTRAIHRSTLKEKAQQLEKEVEEFETWDVFSWPQCSINITRPSYVLATNVEVPQPFCVSAGVTLHTLGSSVGRSFVLCSCAAIVVRTPETYEKTQTDKLEKKLVPEALQSTSSVPLADLPIPSLQHS